MYHVNPYIRSLYSRRRSMSGVADYHTTFFETLPAPAQQQVADILDKGKDSVTQLIQSPGWSNLSPDVQMAIAGERLAVSGGAYSDFIELVSTKTVEDVAAYMLTPEFALKPPEFQLAVLCYVKWQTWMAGGAKPINPQDALIPGLGKPDQPPADAPPVDGQPAGGQPADGHPADGHPTDQPPAAGNDPLASLRSASPTTQAAPTVVCCDEDDEIPLWVYLLAGYVVYQLGEIREQTKRK